MWFADEELVRQTALKTREVSGTSVLKADNWRRILISQNFGNSNLNLHETITKCNKMLCTEKWDLQGVSALMASHLIPLDKKPGLRPAGIGEVLKETIRNHK